MNIKPKALFALGTIAIALISQAEAQNPNHTVVAWGPIDNGSNYVAATGNEKALLQVNMKTNDSLAARRLPANFDGIMRSESTGSLLIAQT
jgi:hypothetical protein